MSQLRRILSLTCTRRPLITYTGQGLLSRQGFRTYSTKDPTDDANTEITLPVYTPREGEPLELKRARLVYQSRKRGMLENGILLSTFAAKYLDGMSEEQVEMYDRLINVPSNDWDIYNWIVKKTPVPKEYNHEVMSLLQKHAENTEMEERFIQPPLN